jgi:hypothetical protein
MLPLSLNFVFGVNVAQNVLRLCHRENRSLHQLNIGKGLMDLKIFLIIKAYVNVWKCKCT